MWIVRLALRRAYTFVVAALLIVVLGAVSVYRMSTDIFPNIDIPVVSVVWQYSGMPADEVESRLILVNERVLTASVNGIEHIESQSLDGVGVIRIYFYPGAPEDGGAGRMARRPLPGRAAGSRLRRRAIRWSFTPATTSPRGRSWTRSRFRSSPGRGRVGFFGYAGSWNRGGTSCLGDCSPSAARCSSRRRCSP
jgi:hypothetical protein